MRARERAAWSVISLEMMISVLVIWLIRGTAAASQARRPGLASPAQI